MEHILEPCYSLKQSAQLGILENLVRDYGIETFVNTPFPPVSEPVSLDIEHDESGGYVGIGIYIPSINSHYWYTDCIYLDCAFLSTLSIVAHNGVSDLDMLRFWGFNVQDNQLYHDTMLFGHIIDSSIKAYGLKDMARRELGVEYPSYDDIVGRRTAKQSVERVTLDKQPPRLVQLYNALDCYVTAKLYEYQSKFGSPMSTGFEHIRPYFNTVEKPLAPILFQMSTRGVRVDLAYLTGLKSKLEAQQEPIRASILNELGNINLNSPKQLLGALHEKEIYPTFKGKPSTDKRAIASYKGTRVIDDLIKFSEIDTLLSSFVYPYLERGTEYVHPFFNQVGTRTGRLSCSNPNLLQIPRRTENGKLVRKMFIPREGFSFGDCDYGQIEPRLMAHLSKDPAMLEMFNSGIDFHSYTSERLGITREKAKVLNLSVGYRATFKSVGQQLGMDKNEAQTQINAWWALFPTLRRWQDKLIYESKQSGYCTTLLGRRIKVDNLSDSNMWRREAAERQLINNIAQASAREVMVLAMIKISQMECFHPQFGILVQVYDELVTESPRMEVDIINVKWAMENAIKLDVPLTVDCKIGYNWAECH